MESMYRLRTAIMPSLSVIEVIVSACSVCVCVRERESSLLCWSPPTFFQFLQFQYSSPGRKKANYGVKDKSVLAQTHPFLPSTGAFIGRAK